MRWWIFLFLILIFSIGQPAQAHGYIVRAIPENRAVLERPPTRLQYWFSEALEPEFSSLNLRDQNGEIIATGGVSETNNTLMTLRVPNDLPDGAYVVELRPAFASDGHVVAESRVFFVGEEIGGVAAAAATDQALPLEVAWKVVVYTASLLLFGTFTLYALVLIPAWGSTKYPAGWLPPRVMTRLNVIVGVALTAALLGNGFALIQQTMVFFNISFEQALQPNFWSLVRIGSRFGDIWNARMLFLGIIGVMFLASLYFKNTQPEMVRPFWVASAWMAALVIGSFSVLSHAAGSLVLPWVGVTVDWIHALAVGVWIGGLGGLVLVLPVALQPYEGDQRRQALLAVLRRFSHLAVVCLGIVITSGLYSASNWFYSTAEIRTNFGLSLGIKLAMVAVLIGVGAVHHAALRPERYARFQAIIPHLNHTLRLETLIALGVLIAVSVLSATPVPIPEFAQNDVETPTQVQTVDGLTVVLTLLPGGPGVNTYDTTVTRDGVRVDGLNVSLMQAHPATDRRSLPHLAEPVEDGLYVAAGDDIDRPGRWWSIMDITTPDGTSHRLAFDWEIDAQAAVVESIPPNIWHYTTLLLLSIVMVWAAYPTVRRWIHKMNLDVLSVSIAISAVIATSVALIIGYMIIQNTRAQYEETLNPTPQVVNAVLPTQSSLDRGKILFSTACDWDVNTRDFITLRDRLPRTRDDELFYAVQDGWRGLPACAPDLSFYQRWDIVNYLRTWADYEGIQ
ncbi:MAG: hypothetical protein Kow00117_00180 [Phototrophicales bacterium]